MSTAFQRAMRSWEFEVDAEAARLIEKGFAPYDALSRARSIVSERRRQAQPNPLDILTSREESKPHGEVNDRASGTSVVRMPQPMPSTSAVRPRLETRLL